MSPSGVRRLRGTVKTAIAAAITKAHDHGLAGPLARRTYRPLVLGYHRVVEDFESEARVEMPSMLTSRAMFERHLDCLGEVLPLRHARRDRRAPAERRPVREAGGRHHLRRWVSRRLRARAAGARAQRHSGGDVRRHGSRRPPVLADPRQAVSPRRQGVRVLGRSAAADVRAAQRPRPARARFHASLGDRQPDAGGLDAAARLFRRRTSAA